MKKTRIILPESIINYIISYITEETPTSLLIKQYNIDKLNNFICGTTGCNRDIRERPYLKCPKEHINCWFCLVKNIKIYDLTCCKCSFEFRSLEDEMFMFDSRNQN